MKESYALLLAAGVEILADKNQNCQVKFKGVANSGDAFNYYGNKSIIDLSDIFESKLPILYEHDRDKRLGVGIVRPVADAQTQTMYLKLEGEFLDNQLARDIINDARQGFPLQLSVHVVPSRVENISEGVVTVNGREISAPVEVLRGCAIREVSFTPTGVDSQTSVVVLSENFLKTNEEKTMEKNQSSQNQSSQDAEIEKLNAEISALKKRIEELEAENDALKKEQNASELDASLLAAGFKKTAEGSWQGLSAGTYNILLGLKACERKELLSLRADSKGGSDEDGEDEDEAALKKVPEYLLKAQLPVREKKLAENPLVADARSRADKQKFV